MAANKIETANTDFIDIFRLQEMDSCVRRVHPLVKLLTVLVYITTVISFHKYDYLNLFAMILFPLFFYQLSLIPVHTCFMKMRIVLPFILLVGIFNPFFDKNVLLYVGNIALTGGIISLITVMLKGIMCLLASFLLIATTTIEEICGALLILHFPSVLVNVILLCFRYIFVLIDETKRMWETYKLRAPGQKGIAFNAWGPFLGQMILRSMDRSRRIHENMILRGFSGKVYYSKKATNKAEKLYLIRSIMIAVVSCVLMIAVRVFHFY